MEWQVLRWSAEQPLGGPRASAGCDLRQRLMRKRFTAVMVDERGRRVNPLVGIARVLR